jgi:hypothetical protein
MCREKYFDARGAGENYITWSITVCAVLHRRRRDNVNISLNDVLYETVYWI